MPNPFVEKEQLTEERVRQIFYEIISKPINLPQSFKRWIPAYLELNQPNFFLAQILGWKSYIGDNKEQAATADLTLSTTITDVPGASITLYNPGRFLVVGTFELEVTTGLEQPLNTGFKFPGLGENIAGPDVDWSNPNNILADDTNNALATVNTGQSCDFLRGTQFGFAIPTTSVIKGIELVAEIGSLSIVNDMDEIQLVKAGTGVGTPKSQALNAGWGTYTWGSSTDLWGTTWTPADINATNFGVQMRALNVANSATLGCDYYQIKVYYVEPGPDETVAGYLNVNGTDQVPAVSITAESTSGTKVSSTGIWTTTTTSPNTIVKLRGNKPSASSSVLKFTTSTKIITLKIG